MEIAFFVQAIVSQGEKWRRHETWLAADHCPCKGDLVEVTVSAPDGALVQREMRVVEVCHTGPRNAQVYLVPTYVKV